MELELEQACMAATMDDGEGTRHLQGRRTGPRSERTWPIRHISVRMFAKGYNLRPSDRVLQVYCRDYNHPYRLLWDGGIGVERLPYRCAWDVDVVSRDGMWVAPEAVVVAVRGMVARGEIAA